jgi:uncharacterized protein YdeI (YjbR/CyaY-like superfamily)
MPSSSVKTFSAVLEPGYSNLNWVIARIPFDIVKAWPVRKGLRVRGEINGYAFRTALFPDPRGEGRVLVVNQRMQAGAKAKVGSLVKIKLEPDLDERAAQMPPELVAALKEDRRLRRWFDGLPEYTRKVMGAIVGEAKSAEAREKRAARIAEWLLLTLEAENELPPILRAAFLRQPQARAGWDAMTKTQRRNHLLGIFHYQAAGSRQRRVDQAVEDALRVAKRKTTGKSED